MNFAIIEATPVSAIGYEGYGAVKDFWAYKGPECILEGPYETGKTRACLEKLNALLAKYPRSRALMVRGTYASEIIRVLKRLGCNPIAGMAMIAMNEDAGLDLRGRMFAELAGYIAPKRKAVEHTGDLTVSQFVIMGATPDATAADWERRNQETMQ